jgi:dTDP-L-rhamnose 4-epimerase
MRHAIGSATCNQLKGGTRVRVLITGGAGFIGSAVALQLNSVGAEVTILDNLSPQVHGDDPSTSPTFLRVKDAVRFVKGDVRSREDMSNVLAGQDHVLHLAAETGTGQSMYQVHRYGDVNVQGTAVLLDLLVESRQKVKSVVLASSRSVYGEGKYECTNDGAVYPPPRSEEQLANGQFEHTCPACDAPVVAVPTDEDSKLNPTSVYAVTKLTQEQLVMSVCRAIGLSAIALRFQNVFGPGQSLINPYTGIISVFSKAISDGQEINIFEDGLESRDFVYVQDVVAATTRALEFSDGPIWETINVGSGSAVTVLDVLHSLRSSLNVDAEYRVSGNYRHGDIRHSVADIRRMEQVLKYRPKWSFDEGIAEYVAWATCQDLSGSGTPSDYQNSLDEMHRTGMFK